MSFAEPRANWKILYNQQKYFQYQKSIQIKKSLARTLILRVRYAINFFFKKFMMWLEKINIE